MYNSLNILHIKLIYWLVYLFNAIFVHILVHVALQYNNLCYFYVFFSVMLLCYISTLL